MKTKLRILIGALVSLSIQFGLAIAGWGGWRPFFAHAAMRALVWLSLGLVLFAVPAGGNLNTGEKEDRSNRWVLAAFMVLALLGAYLSAYTDRIGFWTIDGDTVRWVGVAVCAAGGLLRIAPVYVLGNRFSGLVAIQAGHKLETHGLYGVIRNPSYLGLLITVVGWVLVFRSGVGLLLSFTQLVPLVARIRAEERLLLEHFGPEYEAYRARTWRLIPGVY